MLYFPADSFIHRCFIWWFRVMVYVQFVQTCVNFVNGCILDLLFIAISYEKS